ncbi:MAG TPA: nickel/cobalt efflux transporter [Caulobacteraceae bacterium]|jgi:ABC-type nickel/cobalt efflux system permease component RcnA|nr:nickel/cobalt efflux transporter [Caulobacteraceae bacterium]
MTDIATLIRDGSGNLWLFIPSAIALGALHGLEPGHSKTMMAAFIVAIRGTVGQAALLGVAATVSHTAVVWAVALAGLSLGSRLDLSEPWFQLASAAAVCVVGVWMVWRTWREQRAPAGAGRAEAHYGGHSHPHQAATDHLHLHDHSQGDPALSDAGAQDAHARSHADDIRRRFAGRPVTTAQLLVFGLTGGLVPCPASITVLLLCLQLRQLAMGALLVLCFSVGLAMTLVSVGAAAALGLRHAQRRWTHAFDLFARRAPYASGVLIVFVGLWIGLQGVTGLGAP